ncbi:uncharacterized protein TM35_000012320 [Trypanosoma theileri]|uniref:Uncharacterized protein n=1 Tax=Trypanosoma theileri TaxID=67003 RepID=A0A1X0P955_9TRYP|nr:uncharacterized protein TM35_000012320 [Trypanosoma theileri]ORC93355.1 hypothetical protein TM35_000012320 [Trypanosoma theileri]
MTIGATVRRKTVAAARQWRKLHFKTLRKQLLTPHAGEIRLPLVSREIDQAPQPTITIKVETNNEDLLRQCQLEYFGFFHPISTNNSINSTNSEICIHVGPPKSLGCPYTLTSEADNFTEAVRRSEEKSVWEETDIAEVPHSTRWLTQPLIDGFISRRVTSHVGLNTETMSHTLMMARKLNLGLSPYELSPYYFANDLLSSWGIFSSTESLNSEISEDDVSRLVNLAHASAVLPLYRSVWLNGSALCDDNGNAVLILGSRKSGKTTLALHCLANSSSSLRLIGLENFHLAPSTAVVNRSTSGDGSIFLLMGIPSSAKVGIGAIIGTLRPNPILAQVSQDFNYSTSIIHKILQNSENVIWNMASRYQVNISEAFGSQRWSPTWFGRLKGIVVLNWDIQELSLPQSSINPKCFQHQTILDKQKTLTAIAEKSSTALFKGHYLIRSTYDESSAFEALDSILFTGKGSETPPVYELTGSVSFDMAVQLICRHLLKDST